MGDGGGGFKWPWSRNPGPGEQAPLPGSPGGSPGGAPGIPKFNLPTAVLVVGSLAWQAAQRSKDRKEQSRANEAREKRDRENQARQETLLAERKAAPRNIAHQALRRRRQVRSGRAESIRTGRPEDQQRPLLSSAALEAGLKTRLGQ